MIILTAVNRQGGSVQIKQTSVQRALERFDREYTRSGFVISITNTQTGVERIIKKTHR